MKKTSIPLIRDLSTRYSHEEIEHCITQHLTNGANPCLTENDPDTAIAIAIAILAKASYVSELVKKGLSLQQSMRVLGAQLRLYINDP